MLPHESHSRCEHIASCFVKFKILRLLGNISKHGLYIKREVKMAGYWPSSFFFCVFMDRDGVEVHKLAKKKERGQYPAIFNEKA